MSDTKPTTPTIGMGATAGYGSDCYPFTVIEVSKSAKKIVVQSDSAVMAKDGEYFGQQKWVITRNENGGRQEFTLRKNGRWVTPGCDMWSTGNLVLGHRHRSEDPHF